jgi:type I restriction enzyme S subunit
VILLSEWKECTIADLGEVVGGATPSTKKSENYENGDISWITPKDLSTFNGRYIRKGERNITETGLKSCSTKMLPKNTVLFSSRAPIGYVAIAAKEMCTNQGFKSVIPNADTDFMFLYYLLKFNKDNIENMGSGTTFKEVSGSTMKSIKVFVPTDILEQRKIASVLSSIDDKIELNTKINENLEQQAQAIFKSWFVDFEPFGGVMPTDWYIGTIKDLSKEIICGKTPSTKKKEYYGFDIPFITIPDMHNCIYALSTERCLSKLGAESQIKKTLPKNAICVSCIGTAGLVVLVPTESQTNQQINSIIPKSGYSSYYIYLLMQTMSEKINRLGQSGSTIVNLNKAQFGLMEALVPSMSCMTNFDSIVNPLFEKILLNQRENQLLSALRDTLLPKLMNGEIDVSNVQILAA